MDTDTAPRAPMTPPEGPFRIGLIGDGIALSRTPRMHVEAATAAGLELRYDLIDTAGQQSSIGALLDRVEAEGYHGVNVTHPFKQAVLPHLHALSDAARAIGAVNTVVFRNGRRIGHNTDCLGFAEAFRRTLADAARAQVLLLGTGGAGAAVARALLDLDVGTLFLYDTHAAAAQRLADTLAQQGGAARVRRVDSPDEVLGRVCGLVNATPVGMAAHPGSPVPPAALRPTLWVADIIYFPLETALLRAARARGCRCMDGSGMAVFQAVHAFELFTGRRPDPDGMRATFDAFGAPGR